MEKSTSQLDPMVVLRDTVSRFRRKANECQFAINNIGMHDPYPWTIQQAVYDVEADRLDDLISLCDGTATKNASADTLPVTAETIDDIGVVNEQT
jgi:threonine dehydratase